MHDKVLSHTQGKVEQPIQLVCDKNEFSHWQAKYQDDVNECEKGDVKPIKYFTVSLERK